MEEAEWEEVGKLALKFVGLWTLKSNLLPDMVIEMSRNGRVRNKACGKESG